MTPNPTHIPANLPRFPDLLDGWIGPVRVMRNGRRQAAVVVDTSGVGIVSVYLLAYGSTGGVPTRDLHLITLDLDNPESRAQLARVLTRGLACDNACTSGKTEPGVECARCNGTGHLRPPHPIRHLLPADELGELPAALGHLSASLLCCSALRVSVGLGVVRGVLGRWMVDGWTGRDPAAGEPLCAVVSHDWVLGFSGTVLIRGPETDDLGKAAADSAALAAGFALLQPDGTCVLPWPTPTEDRT